MVNKAYVKIYASTTPPNPTMNVYWADLGANAYGGIIKYWNGNIYAPILGGSPIDPVNPDGSEYSVLSESGFILIAEDGSLIILES